MRKKEHVLNEGLRADFLPPRLQHVALLLLLLLVVGDVSPVGRVQVVRPGAQFNRNILA